MRIQAEIAFAFQVKLRPNQDKINCAICFEDSYTHIKLNCGHQFCSWCIAKYTYLSSNRTSPICPTCRGCILEDRSRLLAYYHTVTDFRKPRRSSRASKAPLRFSTDGVQWFEYS